MKADVVKFHPIKDYIKKSTRLRSNDKAVSTLTERFNSLLEETIKEAAKLAKEQRRKTILTRDMKEALEKTVGKRHLNWQEILDELALQSSADLGKISKGIFKYVEKHEKKK
jgi:histone H3/H4